MDAALEALPEPFRAQAKEKLLSLRPTQVPQCVVPTSERRFQINGYQLEIAPDGSLHIQQTPHGKTLSNAWLGRLECRVYSAKTVTENLERYNRDLEHTRVWAEGDFAKPGLDQVDGLTNRCFSYTVEQVEQKEDLLLLWLKADPQAGEEYGASRQAVVIYLFGDTIKVQLRWFQKDANRIPEGIFFGMNPGFSKEEQLQLMKLGLPIDPFNVRKGGNRKLHIAPSILQGDIQLESHHAPLVSVGGVHLYDENEEYGDLDEGVYYVLFNNRWNPNFRLWYEENASFDFSVHL